MNLYVDRTEIRLNLRDGLLTCLEIAHIELVDRDADLFLASRRRRVVPGVIGRDLEAGLLQRGRNCLADTARPSGD